jgi:hypothetical protein
MAVVDASNENNLRFKKDERGNVLYSEIPECEWTVYSEACVGINIDLMALLTVDNNLRRGYVR